jgi:hypothetical protein
MATGLNKTILTTGREKPGTREMAIPKIQMNSLQIGLILSATASRHGLGVCDYRSYAPAGSTVVDSETTQIQPPSHRSEAYGLAPE